MVTTTAPIQQQQQLATLNTQELAQALVACNGDLRLVSEQLAIKHPDLHITDRMVLEAFLKEATVSLEMQNSVRALLLLNFLQILNEAKDQLNSSIINFTPGEVLQTIKMVVEGITQLLPQPAADKSAGGTQINFLQQFGASEARNRVEAQLATYAAVQEGFSPNSDGNDKT